MPRYILEYLDPEGRLADRFVAETPAEAQQAFAELVPFVVLHDDDADRDPSQPEFVAGSIHWYEEID